MLCHFNGFFATTSTAARLLLGSAHIAGIPVVADLSLGSWQAMSIARQLAGQLGLDLPELGNSRYLELSRVGSSYADLVSYGIDMESQGNRIIDTVLDLAARFCRAVRETPVTLIIIPPRFGAPWEDEDLVFLTMLAREIEQADILFLCCDSTPPPLPEYWHVAWQNTPQAAAPGTTDLLAQIPRVVPETLVVSSPELATSSHVRLMTGWIVVAPETRRDPRAVSRLDWDRFARAAMAIDPSLAIYGQYHGNNLHVDTAAMVREAWLQFAGGGVDIALRYMQRVERCETSVVAKAIALAQQQGMRIAQLRFAEAAQASEPGAGLPPALRSFLLQSQGWGLVHTGHAGRARELLQQAAALLDSEPDARVSREYLYLLNILALADIRCGDAPAALQHEQYIEACLHRTGTRDHALRYVNAINLARIHKQLRDWAKSTEYYDRAFAPTWGLRSETDLVYHNVCRAILYELQGEPAAALTAWVRATLHWLASPRPEALGFRVAQAVAPGLPIFGPASQRCLRWVEEISAALLRRLSAAAAACGRTPRGPARARCPQFARIDAAPAALQIALAGDGWSVFGATDPAWRGHAARCDRGEANALLRTWIAAWIATETECDHGDTYVVDARGGREIATSRSEVIETCGRRGVRRARYSGEIIEIDDAVARRIELETTLVIAPGVDEISAGEPPRVRFKRYREPRVLARGEAILVEFASRSTPMVEIHARCSTDVLACLEPLERGGVVRRTWSADHA
ncbi:MAG TPA: hypothetical protein VHW23_30455 [Kofleriaceae bacterium]|nr:hypothetical protein [Kofleriaceae bacterium]